MTYQDLAQQVLKEIRSGVIPWRKPWAKNGNCSFPVFLPRNAETGKFYRGMNVVVLWCRGHASSLWATKPAWQRLGGRVRQELPARIVYRNKAIHEVYNEEQVDGAVVNLPRQISTVWAEDLISNCETSIFYGGDLAYYEVRTDKIYCPLRSCFKTLDDFYLTLFHEIVHSTAHPARLNRKIGWPEGSDEYHREESVAELGSCFLSAAAGLTVRIAEHSSYLLPHYDLLAKSICDICRDAFAAMTYLSRFVRVQRNEKEYRMWHGDGRNVHVVYRRNETKKSAECGTLCGENV